MQKNECPNAPKWKPYFKLFPVEFFFYFLYFFPYRRKFEIRLIFWGIGASFKSVYSNIFSYIFLIYLS